MNFGLINLVSFLPPTSAKVLHSFFGLRDLVRETHYKKSAPSMESAFFENSPIDFRLQKFINGLALASHHVYTMA